MNMRTIFLPFALGASLFLASCGKKPTDTTQSPADPVSQPETAATTPEDTGTTI